MTSAIKWHLIKQLILNVLSFYHIFDDEGPDPLLVYLLKSGYTEFSVSNYKDEPKATPLKVSSLPGASATKQAAESGLQTGERIFFRCSSQTSWDTGLGMEVSP